MKQIIKISFVFYVVFLFVGCGTLKRDKQRFNIELFNEIEIGSTKKSEVEQWLGKPDRIADGQWTYKSEGSQKMWISFESNIVDSVSMSVWENNKVKSVELLLQEFSGKWTVLKEPMSNPHLAPSLCFLEDLDNGKRVRIAGYKKNVEHITKWKPTKDQKSIKGFLYRNVGKEFCIAGSCSKVTDSDVWKHNHCEWLEKRVAIKQEPVRNKKVTHKKSSKNNNL